MSGIMQHTIRRNYDAFKVGTEGNHRMRGARSPGSRQPLPIHYVKRINVDKIQCYARRTTVKRTDEKDNVYNKLLVFIQNRPNINIIILIQRKYRQ
ncbi:hypothetical protein DPMN_092019 [Dreissena polymorpha]|uniref:Uncharacterized protein n=1 Tax=Dreissena polymorpha TaxID=45954 RepID=A0A9D4QZM1_DREPO|nr:hypothetical protein DPMN_092019 [Dreissena polymorpha]